MGSYKVRVIRRGTVVRTHFRGLRTPLRNALEPPSNWAFMNEIPYKGSL